MERRVKSKFVRGTESINLWTLWIEVLCAMMLSSAGGPSLAQAWRKKWQTLKTPVSFQVYVPVKHFPTIIYIWSAHKTNNRQTRGRTNVMCWTVGFLTRCNASTCRSWKSEVKSLMAWLARITDKTPNPWCLKKNAHKIQSMYAPLHFIKLLLIQHFKKMVQKNS